MEFNLDVDSMKNLKGTVEKCLKDLAQKSDLTPQETKAALDGMELREILKCEIEDRKMLEHQEYSERGYSGHEQPYRQYHITSYGMPIRMNSMSYGYPMPHISYADRDYSGDYGVNGWYRSGDGRSYCGPDYYNYSPEYSDRGRGYSRHSIGDRVVEKIEHMMDGTDSQYEKEELRKFIRMVRSAADN